MSKSKSYVVPWSGKIKVNNLPNDAKVTGPDTKKQFDAEIVFGNYTLQLHANEVKVCEKGEKTPIAELRAGTYTVPGNLKVEIVFETIPSGECAKVKVADRVEIRFGRVCLATLYKGTYTIPKKVEKFVL